MKELLDYYERELLALRQAGGEFAARYPGPASRLQMARETCTDPHVERTIQATALLSARLTKALEDTYPQFTESFLEVLFPHYLRAFPSCAIVRVERPGGGVADTGAIATIPRGTELRTTIVDGVACRFRTCYEITSSPATISHLRFTPTVQAPGSIRLPDGTGATLSITIKCGGPKAGLQTIAAKPFRLYLDGEPSLCATARDTLLSRVAAAYVEDDDGGWIELPESPVGAVGFADDDALVPFSPRSHPAYRLLAEYFTFAEKFNFVDIDLAALLRVVAPGSEHLTLHLLIAGVRADSNAARMLASLSEHNLLPGCSPVVNLFKKTGVPISVTHRTADYALLADANQAHAYDIHTVDSVQMLRRTGQGSTLTEFRPFYSWRHGESAAKQGNYYVVRRDDVLASSTPGHGQKITFVDIEFDPLKLEQASVSVELTCTNRDLPTRPQYCRLDSALTPSSDVGIKGPIRFVRRPTPPFRFQSAHGQHWRLISHLTLNHHSLVQEGLPAFREMLTLYDLPQSPVSRRQIDAIVGLDYRPATAWLRDQHGATLVHGVEVRMTVDEDGFAGSGLHLFTTVIDRFLGLYVQVNSFTELVIMSSKTGEELIRCKPRNGDLNLV
jgi:type VI secretion system protein ImpG